MLVEPPPRAGRFTEDADGRPPVEKREDTTPTAMEAPNLPRNESSGSGSSGDSDGKKHTLAMRLVLTRADARYQFAASMLATPLDDVPPMTSSTTFGRGAQGHARGRRGSGGVPNGLYDSASTQAQTNGLTASRAQRPSAIRTPSNAYAPPRRPTQYSLNNTSNRHRNSSANIARRNPNAEYRAQEKAYVQRIRQDAPGYDDYDLGTPSLSYSTGSETDDESPSTADFTENDPYDQETLLYYGNDDMQPSVEELKIPANRERLEWHSMLASVLTGDVVKQEKKRLIGGGEQQGDNTLKAEIWLGLRARTCGRTVQAQRKLIEDGRSKAKSTIEGIIAFEIKGEAEVGQTAAQQVEDIVKKIEKCESLYPTRQALEIAQPRSASPAYKESCEAIIAWHNTTELINTELAILRSWVGNEELDFSKPKSRPADEPHLVDDSSFIDRILKEDGLKSLQGKGSLLVGLNKVINKAKLTLIANSAAFEERHLPAYMEELQTLMNFPSRLVQEIISMRLSYAKRMKDPAQQGVAMAEQMAAQFQILLTLAVKIKGSYLVISQPEAGWNPPSCIEENFDSVVLDALRFYFRMLDKKLSATKNTFKEAEILEQEWDFSSQLGRQLDGGDVEVAEQFSSLTWSSLRRLVNHFERELQRRPDEVAGPEMDRRYKQILDSVRVRQRKLLRFSRMLTNRFENSTEYNVNLPQEQLQELYEALALSDHFLVENHLGDSDIYILASPSLSNRPADIQTLLGSCFHAEERPEDPTDPYILILKPEVPMTWEGARIEMDLRQPFLDLGMSRLRLVAEGPLQRLVDANAAFLETVAMDLPAVNATRCNLGRVDRELTKIKKTAYKLSNTIMDSVGIIRKQTAGLECQELIQTCFAFATEFGQRSVLYMDHNRRALNNLKLTKLALDWVSFICDDCVASDRKTFRWAVVALEFAMVMTRGQNILSISDEEYAKLRAKVAGCMSLLISHFDIMGARSTMAAQAEKQRMDAMLGKLRVDLSRLKDDEESAKAVQEARVERLQEIDNFRKQKEAERQALGRVLEDSNEADRALTYLSSSATNVTLRWQQGQFIGGGTFGSVYAAINLDSGQYMAVKEIRLQDPQMIPTIVAQIRDEMGVLQVLDHPNIVAYYGIEPHRDRVYIFMEYCSGGSLASLLEHGRIEDEMVIMVYALQMLEGLAYLHERGVVHRDIKPENILLDQDGVIKFVDFGAAKVIARQGKTMAADGGGTRQGRQNSMTGTPMYMSPEVIKGHTSGRLGAVDVWSLGCVILEMATGRRPWASLDNEWAIMYNIAQGNPPQLPTRDQLSEAGIDFLKRCFTRDPGMRASAAELLQHDWIMTLRNQLALEPQTPSDSSSGSGQNSRQNSQFGEMSKQSVCLAYSGGLDTSCILKYLLEQGYDVVCFMADVGQEEDFEAAKEKALKIGAKKCYVEDLRREFIQELCFPAVQCNAIYENVYLLGTSLARPVIARAQIAVAQKEGCFAVSHGCTGKGNDQVRFELAFYALQPTIKVIAPWRDPEFYNRFKGRQDLLDYAEQKGIPVSSTKSKPWSMDENLAHCSYEAGILEDPDQSPPEDMWKLTQDPTKAPDTPEDFTIYFNKGTPSKLIYGEKGSESIASDPLELFLAINAIARKHGVGRIDIVENRFIGLKSRGCYETPGLSCLRSAHLDLEGLVMDREVRALRDQFVTFNYAKILYNGLYFSPEREFLEDSIKSSQRYVNGQVRCRCYKGSFTVLGRSSDTEKLYDPSESSMDEIGDFEPSDTTGFISVMAIRLKKYGKKKEEVGEPLVEK